MSRSKRYEDVLYVMEDQDGVARSAVLYECEEEGQAGDLRWHFFVSPQRSDPHRCDAPSLALRALAPMLGIPRGMPALGAST